MYKSFIIILVTIAVAFGVSYFVAKSRSSAPINPVACTMEAKLCPDGSSVGRTGPKCEFSACPSALSYTNTRYGFNVSLPASWAGYTIVNSVREVRSVSTGAVVSSAPTVSIRHPLWTTQVPRQDIPIDIYTLEQWAGIVSQKYSIGAAPIPPSELARSSQYVFALPARYNFAYLVGFEEVEQIINSKMIKAFELNIIKETNTAFLNQKILNGGIYITPLQVVSDSRCPVDVQCVWAGEILIKVKLEKGEISKEIELKQGTPVLFENSNVSLVNVAPANKAKVPILPKDYQFTFKVFSTISQGTISGTVTLGPTCPVERIPPDPNCAPRFYATSINILKTGSLNIIKTIQSDSKGAFSTNLDLGSYTLQTHGGNVLPRCGEVSVEVKSNQYTTINISCDTGIR